MISWQKIEGKQKGSKIFVKDGFIYTKSNVYKDKINLRCHRHKNGCTGTAAIEFSIFSHGQPHMHTEEYAEIEKTMIETKMKREAERTILPSRDIYDSNIKNTSACAKVNPFRTIVLTLTLGQLVDIFSLES